jgi:NAD(P)-dependent dehydrogenase (short-subunit alcohol dehydrogenase family)
MNSKPTLVKSELAGQVAVVTGGGRGIGRSIAATVSAAGMATAVLARTASEIEETARTIEQSGGRARPFVTDVADAAAVRRAITEIERTFGCVGLLINNAAIPGPIGPFCETDVEQWWRTLDINLRGVMLCSRAVLPGMIARRKGRIINIGSSALPIPYFSAYATSKAALVRFTETVAAEVKPHGVSMFAMGPGTVRTSMAEHSLRSSDGRKWLPWFKQIFDQGLDVPAERPSRLVLELASGRADSLSGRFLSIWDDLDSLLRNLKQIEERNLYSLRIQTLDGGGVGSALSAIRAAAESPVDWEPQNDVGIR